MKLVRDKIPEIMRAAGQVAVTHTADSVEFPVLLRQKLTEEVDEFLISQDPEVEALRQAKAELRGGFAERVVWHGPRSAVPAPVL